MEPKSLTEQCIESISNNPTIRNQVKSASDEQRRVYLTLWHDGYRRANPKGDVPNLQEFLNEATPELRKTVAA